MGLEYATEHLTAAVGSLAKSELPLPERLQQAWNDQVQMLWMQPCLTVDLLAEFRDLWHRYTAPSDDRTSTALRDLTKDEIETAINQLMALWVRTYMVAAQNPDVKLATLADLT